MENGYNYLKNWYWNAIVKFNIINYTKNRAVDFIASKSAISDKITTRARRIHSVQHFDVVLKSLNCFFQKKIYNMYYSMAEYKEGIPIEVSTFNLRDRDLEKWNAEHYKNIIGYDFFIDVDSPDFENLEICFRQTKIICKYLDSIRFPYYLRFSGKGFHIVTPYKYFKVYDDFNSDIDDVFNPNYDDNIYKLYREIALSIKYRFTEMIDTTIYDSRRVLKIPFSLAIYKDKTKICCPFSMKYDIQWIEQVCDFNNYELFFNFLKSGNFRDILNNPDGDVGLLLKDLKMEKFK